MWVVDLSKVSDSVIVIQSWIYSKQSSIFIEESFKHLNEWVIIQLYNIVEMLISILEFVKILRKPRTITMGLDMNVVRVCLWSMKKCIRLQIIKHSNYNIHSSLLKEAIWSLP